MLTYQVRNICETMIGSGKAAMRMSIFSIVLVKKLTTNAKRTSWCRKMASTTNQGWMVDSGILRKKNNDEQPQELLVFGYSCKLFRDDDKAIMIDRGKHLIPWMGDNTLKIDRSVSPNLAQFLI